LIDPTSASTVIKEIPAFNESRTMKYVLITPAHNEQQFIEQTLSSMLVQTAPPERWVIVDDGSTDNTAEIIESYSQRCPWIDLQRLPQREERSFSRKVHAFNAGLEQVRNLQFDVIGNLDADLSFEPDYLEFLMSKFAEDPSLGVAGTPFTEDGYDSAVHSFEGANHVAGGCQLFRRACFDKIGGYVANPAGGIDWIAVTSARMMGWKTQSFPDKRFHHYRTLGTAGKSDMAALFSYGQKDFYLGNSPIWEAFRILYRGTKKPIGLGAASLLAGYSWAALTGTKKAVSPELMRFHRREEMRKLRAILSSLLRLKKVDNFHLAPVQDGASNSAPSPSG
jgi:poly-beta-1,6-N-acetyl-D-glucosamine synthase